VTVIVAVRVSGDHGFVFVGSQGRPAGALSMEREHGRWRVQGLLADPSQNRVPYDRIY
jgi:hypothetical protein